MLRIDHSTGYENFREDQQGQLEKSDSFSAQYAALDVEFRITQLHLARVAPWLCGADTLQGFVGDHIHLDFGIDHQG